MKRWCWIFGAVVSVVMGWHSQSDATIVRAVSLDEITRGSEEVVVATVVNAKSHYVTIRGRRRMVTDSELLIDHVVIANRSSTSAESQVIHVRTLGGTADGLAHLVHGEAALTRNTTHFLFLRMGSDGQLWVSAMAQGQYVVEPGEDGQNRLRPSARLDVVTHPERSVVSVLAGTTLDQAEAIVAASYANVRLLP